MSHLIATIEGLQFENTPVGLARQLGAAPGVAGVEVDARTGTVKVGYDDTRLTEGDVRLLIRRCGYHVRAVRPARATRAKVTA